MNPVISPWFFYWVDVLGGLKSTAFLLSIIGPAVAGVISLFATVDSDDDTVDLVKTCWKRGWPLIPLLVLIATFCPCRKTMISMVVAREITYERLEKLPSLGGIRETLKQDVIDIIEATVKEEDDGDAEG